MISLCSDNDFIEDNLTLDIDVSVVKKNRVPDIKVNFEDFINRSKKKF